MVHGSWLKDGWGPDRLINELFDYILQVLCMRWFASSKQFGKTMIQAIRIEFPKLNNAIRQQIRLGFAWRTLRLDAEKSLRVSQCSIQ